MVICNDEAIMKALCKRVHEGLKERVRAGIFVTSKKDDLSQDHHIYVSFYNFDHESTYKYENMLTAQMTADQTDFIVEDSVNKYLEHVKHLYFKEAKYMNNYEGMSNVKIQMEIGKLCKKLETFGMDSNDAKEFTADVIRLGKDLTVSNQIEIGKLCNTLEAYGMDSDDAKGFMASLISLSALYSLNEEV